MNAQVLENCYKLAADYANIDHIQPNIDSTSHEQGGVVTWPGIVAVKTDGTNYRVLLFDPEMDAKNKSRGGSQYYGPPWKDPAF